MRRESSMPTQFPFSARLLRFLRPQNVFTLRVNHEPGVQPAAAPYSIVPIQPFPRVPP